MSNVIMSTARNLNDDGSIELVQVPGTPYEAGHHYYSPAHHRNLVCSHCDARVHLNAGTDSIAGSFRGRRAHFHTNPGQIHKNCLWLLRDYTPSEHIIDKTIGYRIHVNTLRYSEVFNRHSGIYKHAANGHIVSDQKDLQSREAFSIRSADEIITLMRKGELGRINDSVVIYNNRSIPWRGFFLHLREPKRYVDLLERLRLKGKYEPSPAALMEINLPKRHHSQKGMDRSFFNAERIEIGKDRRGLGAFIVPSINLPHGHNTHLRDIFSQSGRYLVLASPVLKTKEMDYVTYHYLNVQVTDVRQVYFGNIADIAKEAKMNAQKRDGNSAPGIASP